MICAIHEKAISKSEKDNEKLEQVNLFKYLGIKVHYRGDMAHEINEKISTATQIYYTYWEERTKQENNDTVYVCTHTILSKQKLGLKKNTNQ